MGVGGDVGVGRGRVRVQVKVKVKVRLSARGLSDISTLYIQHSTRIVTVKHLNTSYIYISFYIKFYRISHRGLDFRGALDEVECEVVR